MTKIHTRTCLRHTFKHIFHSPQQEMKVLFYSKIHICGAFLSALGEIKQSVPEPEMIAIVQ